MIPLFKVAMSPAAPESVKRTLLSGYIGQGEKVKQFEDLLSDFFHHPILTTSSCTAALDLALHLCNVQPGDEVISTPLTCTATNGVIANRGATIVWSDVLSNGCIDPNFVSALITSKTKAIVAVDWGGTLCDYVKLRSFGIPVIQDAAHRFSAIDHSLGGNYTCWSFQAIKFLTTGDGGALAVPAQQYERAKLLRWYGLDRESKASFRCEQDIREIGYKYHMNDIAATIGIANFDLAIQNQHQHYRNYAEILKRANGNAWVAFTRIKNRDAFIKFMADRGIETSLVHKRNDQHTAFARVSKPSHLPSLDIYSKEYVALPCGWWLTEEDILWIRRSIADWNDSH